MKDVFDNIKHEYALQRARNIEEQRRRNQTVQSRSPRLCSLLDEKEALLIELPQSILIGNDPTGTEKQLNKLNAAIQTELKKLELPSNYLDIQYKCEKCRDTGYIGHNGRRAKCACLIQRQIDAAYGDGPAEYTRHSFENFNISLFPESLVANGTMTQREYMEKLKSLIEQYASSIPAHTKPGIILYGQTGLGKTYLLNCIRKRVLEQGHSVLRLTSFQLFEELKEIHFSRGRSSVDGLLSAALLIIDDLGTEPFYQNITCEYLFSVLNEAMQRNIPIAIATNLMPNELKERYGERAFSRLFDKGYFSAYALEGRDIRLGR